MTITRRLVLILPAAWAVAAMSISTAATIDNDALARHFVARHEAAVRPLETESWRRWWEANITGSDEAFQKKEQIETRLNLLLANRETFTELKAIHARLIADKLLARQIELLYLQYLARSRSIPS